MFILQMIIIISSATHFFFITCVLRNLRVIKILKSTYVLEFAKKDTRRQTRGLNLLLILLQLQAMIR